MTQKQILERNKRIFTELFIGADIMDYTEQHLGIDYRIALQGELTPYIKYLISQSWYFDTQKGERSDLQMVQELIYSRCIELYLLEKWGGKLVLNGSDKDSLITRFATNQSDMWEFGSNNYYEVISTYGGTFINKGYVFISKPKFENLRKSASTVNQYIIAVDVMYQKYCFLPINADIHLMKYAKELPLKDGYNLSLEGLEWFDINENDIITGE